jgi:hypothetical protein
MSEYEELPPAPFDDSPVEPKHPTDSDEVQDIANGDYSEFDVEIMTDQAQAQSKPGGFGSGFDPTKICVYKQADKKYAVPQRWYWGNICRRMINHNKSHGFTGCVLIGMSGSGKTTLTNTLLHYITDVYKENYTIHWFNGHHLIEIDKHIKKLQVGVPHILVFDDASYTLEDAGKTQMATLANALTTIRHQVKSRIIIFFNIHYSRATKKFFRNQHFTFLTSVTTEELGNLKDLFQDKMPVVRQFAKKYRQMALNGAFYVPLDYYTGKSAKYKINEPFRVGMVSEITDLHFFLYPRASCAKCVPGGEKPFEPKTTKELMNMLSKYKNQTAMISTLAFWIKTHNIQKPGVDPLEGPYKSYWNFFEKVSRANPAPWHDILEGMRAKQASRGPRTRSIRGTHITGKSDEFEQVLKKRGPGRPKLTSQEISRRRLKDAVLDPDDYNNTDSENTEKTEVETLTEFPDYDSTYVRPPNEKI